MLIIEYRIKGERRTSSSGGATSHLRILDEGVLELIYILHKLLVHLDLLHRNLPGIGQVVPHVVVFFVLDGPLERSDHLTFSLDELDLLLDCVQVRVVDTLFRAHSLLFKCLWIHHAVGTHFQVWVIVLLHHVIILLVVSLARVHRHLLGAHEGRWWGVELLRHLLLLELLVGLLSLSVLSGHSRPNLLLRQVLCVAASHGLGQSGRHLAGRHTGIIRCLLIFVAKLILMTGYFLHLALCWVLVFRLRIQSHATGSILDLPLMSCVGNVC